MGLGVGLEMGFGWAGVEFGWVYDGCEMVLHGIEIDLP